VVAGWSEGGKCSRSYWPKNDREAHSLYEILMTFIDGVVRNKNLRRSIFQ
jgi:hypothetical protein